MVALKKDGFEAGSINHSIDIVSVTTTKATVSLSSYSPKPTVQVHFIKNMDTLNMWNCHMRMKK